MRKTKVDYTAQVDKMIKRAENGKIAYTDLDKIFKEDISEEEVKQVMEYIDSNKIEITYEEEEEEKEQEESGQVTSALKVYVRELGKYPLLNGKKEIELGRRIRQGDKAAREEMINSNLRLVISIAKHFEGQADIMDLIGYGNEGLINAVDKFDPERGNRFSTMAVWWIRQAISRNISSKESTIRTPDYMRAKISKVIKMEQAFLRENGYKASEEKLAERLRYSMEDMRKIRAAMDKAVSSLDQKVGDDDGSEQERFVENKESANPEKLMENQELQSGLTRALSCLTSRERKVIELRFGLHGGKMYTLEEVGKSIGSSRERIRQIEAKALRKLYRPAQETGLRDFLYTA